MGASPNFQSSRSFSETCSRSSRVDSFCGKFEGNLKGGKEGDGHRFSNSKRRSIWLITSNLIASSTFGLSFFRFLNLMFSRTTLVGRKKKSTRTLSAFANFISTSEEG